MLVRRVPAPVLLTLSALLWGGNFVVGRAVATEIPPLSLSFYRWLTALVVLVIISGRATWRSIPELRRHVGWLAMSSFTGVLLFHTLAYTGLHTTTAINASLITATSPVVIPVVVYMAFREHISVREGVGIVVTMIGVIVVLTRGDTRALGQLHFAVGDLLILGTVVAWAVYSVGLRRRPQLPPLVIVTAVAAVGTLMLLPFYLWEAATIGGFAWSIPHVATILYVGIFASVIAYITWNQGVMVIGPTRAGPYLNLIPLFAAVLAVVFLGESIQGFQLVGGAFIGGGLWVGTT
ncbi:MAG TPA: DMT family transporter [Actinobacteria bacterium]|nr:DMT family transporter [Actinomycetota bacterium]